MDNKTYLTLFMFIFNCSKLKMQERWYMCALMQLQNNLRVDKTKPFKVFPSSFNKTYDITTEFERGLTFLRLYGFISYSYSTKDTYMITIHWDKLTEFRNNYLESIRK